MELRHSFDNLFKSRVLRFADRLHREALTRPSARAALTDPASAPSVRRVLSNLPDLHAALVWLDVHGWTREVARREATDASVVYRGSELVRAEDGAWFLLTGAPGRHARIEVAPWLIEYIRALSTV